MKKITNEEIVQTALSLFSEKGYEATSVDEIARSCGMVKASFYKYFKSKEELLLSAIMWIDEELEREYEKLQLNSHLSPRERLANYYLIALERVYKSKLHMVFLPFPTIESNDVKIAQVTERVESRITIRLLDLMSDLYGTEWNAYYYDVIFAIKSMAISYIRSSDWELYDAEYKSLVRFITSISDILMRGMTNPDNHYEIMWKHNVSIYEALGKPWTRWKQITSLMQKMQSSLDQLDLNETDKSECQQILDRLQQELSEEAAETATIKALLLFLEQIPQLRENCTRMREVLRA
ncbi:TetR family transcriptional regulator [Paenibacillus sp. TH7-28]